MAGSTKSKSAIKSVDPLWTAILADAEAIAASEPSLSSFVVATVLNHDRFETALAHRLSERLDHNDVSGDLIRQAFDDVIEATPEIGLAARADLAATLERDPACDRAIEPFLYFKGFHAVQTHRFAHALYRQGFHF